VLTRVERPIGGKVPPEFATVADLRDAHEIDPFTALQICPAHEGSSPSRSERVSEERSAQARKAVQARWAKQTKNATRGKGSK
jgi:hypothetical protein